MNKIYYLDSCDKCRKILQVFKQNDIKIDKQDIKVDQITPSQLDYLRSLVDSYETLFSKSARKYKTLENKAQLKELDYRNLILSEYTYLKRPVILVKDRIFVGVSINKMNELNEFLKK